MSSENNNPAPEQTGMEESAINIKQKESDGREINHQQQSKKQIHQPRDNA